MAKKDNTVKSFILRVDADMMEAIEAWAADEFRSTCLLYTSPSPRDRG